MRNTQGIKSIRLASAIESDLLALAYSDSIRWMETDTVFTAGLIAGMHRTWLETLYPMAGKFRVVDLSKAGFSFCHALYIPDQMARFEVDHLARCTPCSGTFPEVTEKIASIHAELLMIHPFRDGNGRLARWIADLMALQAGLPPPKYDLGGSKNQPYFSALRRGYLGDVTELAELFASWIERAQRQRTPAGVPKRGSPQQLTIYEPR